MSPDTLNIPYKEYGVLSVRTANGRAWVYQEVFHHGIKHKFCRININNTGWTDWEMYVTNSIISITQDMIIANRVTLKHDHANQIIKVGNIRILNTYFTANVDSDIHMAILSISEKPSLAICREFLSLSNQRFEAFLGYGHDLEIRYLKTGDEYGFTLIWTV